MAKIKDRIDALRNAAQYDEGAKLVYRAVIEYYPVLIDKPKKAPDAIKKEYNRLIDANIPNRALRGNVLISPKDK